MYAPSRRRNYIETLLSRGSAVARNILNQSALPLWRFASAQPCSDPRRYIGEFSFKTDVGGAGMQPARAKVRRTHLKATFLRRQKKAPFPTRVKNAATVMAPEITKIVRHAASARVERTSHPRQRRHRMPIKKTLRRSRRWNERKVRFLRQRRMISLLQSSSRRQRHKPLIVSRAKSQKS